MGPASGLLARNPRPFTETGCPGRRGTCGTENDDGKLITFPP